MYNFFLESNNLIIIVHYEKPCFEKTDFQDF